MGKKLIFYRDDFKNDGVQMGFDDLLFDLGLDRKTADGKVVNMVIFDAKAENIITDSED